MEPKSILVVEDESIVAQDIRNMLLSLGYNVTGVVTTAKEAVDTAKKKKPTLVLMDVMLGGDMSGVRAANTIYNQYMIPIVYLTAYADETILQRAKKTEPFGYLLKPFEERELQTTIEIALYKFQMEMKLKNREKWLSTILKSTADAVIATNIKGLVSFMNPVAEKLTGWIEAKALDKPLAQVFSIRDEESGEPYSLPLPIDEQAKGHNLPKEALLVSAKGKQTPIQLRTSSILDEKGLISGAVLTFSNIDWWKKAEEDLRQSYLKLKQTMDSTVKAMAHTIETRDPYTAGHQRRVTQLACAIAEKLGLSGDRLEGLQMAGELHDIGKIFVPAEILSKPGQITDAEYNIIKTHPKVGYDILKNIEFPWPIHEFVHQHHERMDGSGYPLGLKGKQIHLEARILAVADVIEAMSSHRPYRPALPLEEALEEITQKRGKLYDPEAVDACVDLFKRDKFKIGAVS